jgi:tRNA A37 threonylcarbamoyladenosine modification protein TsaB
MVAGVQFAAHVDARPSIDALIALGVDGAATDHTVAPDEIVPLYLRQSDAEINATVVAGGRG